ncbi:MAG: MarR family transcriptional regulator [Clostridia bacterium]|nr:MarR family transcriptional regulator [Clostridia bacterium]
MNRNQSCGALIKQLHDELEKRANNELRAENITSAQVGALLVLHESPEGRLPLKELEQRLHVSQATAAGIVVRLEQKGMVQGVQDASDRRIKLVSITREGVERCRRAEKHMEDTENRLLSGLTETEREIFATLLKKVRDTML